MIYKVPSELDQRFKGYSADKRDFLNSMAVTLFLFKCHSNVSIYVQNIKALGQSTLCGELKQKLADTAPTALVSVGMVAPATDTN